MNQLKFLGKPLDVSIVSETKKGTGRRKLDDLITAEAAHYRGAIKEAWELLKIHSSSWPHDVWAYAEQWDAETYGGLVPWKEERVKDFVAFLLRKTIGDKE